MDRHCRVRDLSRCGRPLAFVVFMTAVALSAAAQQPPVKPQSLMAGDAPAWNRVLKLSDGRTFVTNGHIALDRYVAPSGLWLNMDYIDYLRRVLPAARLRTKRDLDPVVIVLDGKPVGLVMALRGPAGGPQ
jgi:hypothetical protein